MNTATVNIPGQIFEYNNLATFPVTGALKTIYIAKDTNLQYRWTGSAYQLLSENTGGGVESVTGDGVDNTDPLNPVLSFPTPIDIGLGNVDNTSDVNKPVSTAQATAIGFKEDSSNKSTSTSDFASSTKFPVWSVIVSFFDGAKILSLLGISSISGTNTGDETAARIGTIVNGATAYTTPLDADKIGIWDVANSLFKATTWANIKATLKAYFDTKYTNILYSSTADSTATSGTSNTLCSSFLVAANTFTSTNRLRITIRTTKSNTLGTCTLRVYTNNLADLSGATLIGTYASSAAHQIIGTVFNYPFKSSTTIQRISATFTIASDEQGGGVSLAPVTFTFNTASNNYLLFALQNANGTESSVISYLTIEKL